SAGDRDSYQRDPLLVGKKSVTGKPNTPGTPLLAMVEPTAPPVPPVAQALAMHSSDSSGPRPTAPCVPPLPRPDGLTRPSLPATAVSRPSIDGDVSVTPAIRSKTEN